MEKLEKQAKREDGQLLILTPNNGAAAGLSTLPLGLSANEVTNNSSPLQENGELFRFEEDAVSTVLHETIGHGGIQAVAGKRFGQVCQQVYDMMSDEPRSLLCQKHQ